MAFEISEVVYKFYPVNSSGQIVMNSQNSFGSVEEIIEFLNTAPGNPPTTYAQVPLYEFEDV